eukprot:gb/GECH01012321.1/.p1 GENE.gb/GECH01012321.1/~~gb/GECH01012321.1/.p1  ORF type:complete len:409 (+),score=62.24 gb/GECH01012321.1/:1-1227(+)
MNFFWFFDRTYISVLKFSTFTQTTSTITNTITIDKMSRHRRSHSVPPRGLSSISSSLPRTYYKTYDCPFCFKSFHSNIDQQLHLTTSSCSSQYFNACFDEKPNSSSQPKIPKCCVRAVHSQQNQYSLKGKTACTTIAIQAVNELISVQNFSEVDRELVEKILKKGCKEDKDTGTQAFSEVYEQLPWVRSCLKILETVQGSTKEKKTIYKSIKKLADYGRRTAAILTKQPETVALIHHNENNKEPFALYDSHPRYNMGAHILFFSSSRRLTEYLHKYRFEYLDDISTGLDAMYNSYEITIIEKKKDTTSKCLSSRNSSPLKSNYKPYATSSSKSPRMQEKKIKDLELENQNLREELEEIKFQLKQSQSRETKLSKTVEDFQDSFLKGFSLLQDADVEFRKFYESVFKNE